MNTSGDPTPAPETPRWLPAGAVAAFLLGVILVLVYRDTPADRLLWSGFGLTILVLTAWKPRWYWDHPKALFFRRHFGDGFTQAFYLAVATACLWAGLFTDWTFGRGR
jgi:hypothetical protein